MRGSHIVTKRLFDHDKCYFFQGTDGRISFAIPYENDFTLIGTTDAEHADVSRKPECTPKEQTYLLDFINQYLKNPISDADVVWTYSGVRPLYDDGVTSASAVSRDYVIKVDESRGAPALNIFGGKITTYRKLAESAMEEISKFFPQVSAPWTAGVAMPGGDFPVDGVDDLTGKLTKEYSFLSQAWAKRLIRGYGTEARTILAGATEKGDLGKWFGSNLTEREVEWLMEKEYAIEADDIVWRRTKLGLVMTKDEISVLDTWMKNKKLTAMA